MVVLAGRYRNARIVSLRQQFALLPLTEDLFDELAITNDDQQDARDDRFLYLCSRTIRTARLFSLTTPIAYVETDYFGGIGSQGAVAWVNEELIFGPAVTTDKILILGNPSEAAINAALQKIGAVKGNSFDEFEALGLGTHRSNEDWLEDQEDL